MIFVYSLIFLNCFLCGSYWFCDSVIFNFLFSILNLWRTRECCVVMRYTNFFFMWAENLNYWIFFMCGMTMFLEWYPGNKSNRMWQIFCFSGNYYARNAPSYVFLYFGSFWETEEFHRTGLCSRIHTFPYQIIKEECIWYF